MKKILYLILIFALFFPFISSAKNLSDVKINFSSDINKDCWLYNSSNMVSGCYHNDNGVDKIFIRKDLPAILFPRVFVHEFGHFLTSDVSDEELNKLFLPPLVWMPVKEVVADSFVLWFFGVKMTPDQDKFFRSLIEK